MNIRKELILLPILLLPFTGLLLGITENQILMMMLFGSSVAPQYIYEPIKIIALVNFYSLPLIGIFDLVSAIEARRIEKRGESIFMQQRYSNLTDMPFSERFCAGYILLVKSVHLIPQVLTLIVGISSYIYSGSPWGILFYYVVVLLGAAVNSYKLKLLKAYGSISSGRLLLYVILQATPFLDFISALYLWRQYRKSGIYVE